MFRFGPSGIPLSCKGRTLRDGIEDVHTLGLTALEVQIVRTNISERYATEEDVGQIPVESEKELIIEVQRGTGKKRRAATLFEPMEKGDRILSMINPIAKNYTVLKQLGEIAKNLDVVLSVHTPYYMDLVANNDLTERSMESIRWAGLMAKVLDAQIVVTHMGMYGDHPRKVAAKNITENLAQIQEWFDESDIKIPLGLETSGRQEIFGSFEEIEAICQAIKGPVPVINFPHVHARGNGSLKKKEDFQELFDRADRFTHGKFYTHFSGVEHENGNEIRYTPIKKGDLKFEPLAECILENDMELTVISGSPLLEHDAMYMRVILERVLSKREAKAERQKAKEEEAPPAKKSGQKKQPAKPAPKKKQPAKPVPKKPAPKAPPKKPAAKKPVSKPKAPVKKPVSKAPAKKPAVKATAKPKPAAKPRVPAKKPAAKAPKKKPISKKPVSKKAPAKKPAPAKPKPKAPARKPVPKSKTAPKKPAPKSKAPAKKPAVKPKKPAAKKPAPKKKR